MIIEKHTQQSDLTKPKGKTEIVYTIKPEDQAEDLKINNFINSQKIPKTTLKDFESEELVRKSFEGYLGIKLPKSNEAVEFKKTQEASSEINPKPLRDAIEKAAKQDFENLIGTDLVCNCLFCKASRGEI